MTVPRVLHLIETLGRGGAERLLYWTLKSLDRTRYEGIVCHLLDVETSWREPIQELGYDVHCIGMSSTYDVRRGITALFRLIREQRIDLIHSHLYFPNIYGGLAGWLRSIPVVSSLHNLVYEPEILIDNKHFSVLKQRGFLMADWLSVRLCRPVLIAVSDAIRKSGIANLGVREKDIVTIHNGIDPEFFSNGGQSAGHLKRHLGIGDSDPVLLSVARMIALKGHRYLLQALPVIRKFFPMTQLVLVGGGPLEDQLKQLATQLGVRNGVHFVSSQGDVREFILACDVFVAPSLSEGFGLSLVEAMALGRPCVASDTGGIPEIVEDEGSGILVPARDSERLATAVSRLLRDPELRVRMGRRGREIVETRFNIRDAVRRLEQLYDGILKGRGVLC